MKARPEPRARRQLAALVLLLALVLPLALAACAPRLAPPGTLQVPEPYLTETHFVTADGLELPLRSWAPAGDPRAVILALHGFNDYSNAFENPGAFWAEQDILTYAFDQRGFGAAPHPGLWAGNAALTGDLADASRAIRARHPGLPLYLLGESMGGSVILAALAGPRPPLSDGVILVAPAVWSRATMPWYQRSLLWLTSNTIPWMKFSGRGLKIQASDNIEMLRGLGRDPLVIKRTRADAIHGLVGLMDAAQAAAPQFDAPALLLYGELDEIVPRKPTLKFWKKLPESARGRQRRGLYENGWHILLRDLAAEVVLADIAQWTGNPEAPLPSGADLRADAALQEEIRVAAEKSDD